MDISEYSYDEEVESQLHQWACHSSVHSAKYRLILLEGCKQKVCFMLLCQKQCWLYKVTSVMCDLLTFLLIS